MEAVAVRKKSKQPLLPLTVWLVVRLEIATIYYFFNNTLHKDDDAKVTGIKYAAATTQDV